MTVIKRFQQGIFEGLAGSNRAAGSGAGSGFIGMQVLAQTGPSGAFANGATMATLTYNLNRAVPVWLIGNANIRGNVAAYVDIPNPVKFDGTTLQAGVYDMTASPAGTQGFPNTLLVTPFASAPGNHSFTIVNTSGQIANVDYSNFLLFALAY